MSQLQGNQIYFTLPSSPNLIAKPDFHKTGETLWVLHLLSSTAVSPAAHEYAPGVVEMQTLCLFGHSFKSFSLGLLYCGMRYMGFR